MGDTGKKTDGEKKKGRQRARDEDRKGEKVERG